MSNDRARAPSAARVAAAPSVAADIAALIDARLGPDRDTAGVARVDAIIEAAAQRGEPRTELALDLVDAIIEDLRRAPGRRSEDRLSVSAKIHDRSVELKAERLERIARARRLMWQGIARPEEADWAIAGLQELVAAQNFDRPALERVWAHHGLAAVLAYQRDYAEALDVAVIAAELARATGIGLVESETSITLSFIFLSVGDIEGAIPVVESGIAAGERVGWRHAGLYYNALLAYVLSDRFQSALSVLDANPWLRDHDLEWGGVLRALVALIYSGSGMVDEADELVRELVAEPTVPWSERNRVWMVAQVMLRAGRGDEALATIDTFLAGPNAQDLTPLNGTQIYLALSEAREMSGDAVGALKALRESQKRAYQWLAESVISRLQAIRIGSLSEARSDDTAFRRRTDLVRTSADAAISSAPQSASAEAASDPTRYFAHVTHDMRNSLQGVMAMISMLQLSGLDEAQSKYAALADASAHSLLALCNDVLDLARIDAGRLEVSPRMANLAEMVTEVASPVQAYCSSSGVAVSVELDPAVPESVYVDPVRFKQIVLNLLSNAAKFTSSGSIVASVRLVGRRSYRVEVADTGIGIAEDSLNSLFEDFTQIDGDDQAAMGSGLGLAVTRQLVELMGGTIGVESTLGVGSTFWVELPLQG